MENRLKERLTGAAILVALIVLIVPELFRGPPPTAPSVHPANAEHDASAANPALHSYDIDLSAKTSVAASGPPATTASGAAPGASVAESAASAGSAAPPGSATSRPPSSVGASTKAKAKTRAGSSEHPPVEHVAAATNIGTAANAVHAAAAARATPWSVQLGLFAKESNAERLAHTAQTKGFMARVVRTGSKGLYRVAIANVVDRGTAEQLSRRLHAAGLPGAIVGPR